MWNNRAMTNRYWVSVVAVALAAAVAGVYVARTLSQPAVASLESGTSLPRPKVLADFTLVDTQGDVARFAANTSDAGVLWIHALPRRLPDHARIACECAETGGDP
jgi:anti-sigma-K factor RskA